MREAHRGVDRPTVLNVNDRTGERSVLLYEFKKLVAIEGPAPTVLPAEFEAVIGMSKPHRVGDAKGRHMVGVEPPG